MGKRLREAIARYGSWMWRRTDAVRELLGRIAAKRERDQENRRRSATRARFWDDLREGQREAEAHCFAAGSVTAPAVRDGGETGMIRSVQATTEPHKERGA